MHVVIHKSDVSCGNVQIIQMLSSTPCKIEDRFPLVATHSLTRAGSLELLAAAKLHALFCTKLRGEWKQVD